MSVLVVIALLVGSCDKKSTEPTSEKPNIPVLVFSQPGFASDSCGLGAYILVLSGTTLASYTSYFAALPATESNGTWTWVLADSGVTYTLTGKLESDGKYHWQVRMNGTVTGTTTTYSNFLYIEGTSAPDGSSGNLTIYDETNPSTSTIAAKITWSTPSAGTILIVLELYSSGQPDQQVTINSTKTAGGTVTMAQWNGSAYGSTMFSAIWTSPDAPATCN